MTTPFNPVIPAGHVPPVAPMYFSQGPSSNEILQQSFNQLMKTLQENKQRELERQKLQFDQQEALRKTTTDEGSGQILATLLPALQRVGGPPALPAMTLPGVVGQVPPTPPFTTGNAMNLAFRDRPGTQVLEASKAAQNEISQAMAREDAQKSAKDNYQLSWQGGKAFKFLPSTGKLEPLLDVGGKQVQVEDQAERGTWMLDGNYETADGIPIERNSKTGMIRPAPYGGKLVRSGPISAQEETAASNYHAMATTWDAMKQVGFPILSKNMVQQVLQIRGAIGGSAMEKWIAENKVLTDTEKAALTGWTNIVRDIVYAQSGKQVTVQEFQAAIRNNIPTESDGPKGIYVKMQNLQGKVGANYRLGFRAIRRNEQLGLGADIAPADLFDLHRGQESGPPPMTPGHPAPPAMLRSPQTGLSPNNPAWIQP